MAKNGSSKRKKKKEEQKRKRVGKLNRVIISNCNCASNPDPPDLGKRNDDRVQWVSGDGGTYAIVFYPDPPTYPYGSPFRDAVFVVKPDGTPTPSGQIRGDADYGDYKYRVVGDNGCDIDPVIHIGP